MERRASNRRPPNARSATLECAEKEMALRASVCVGGWKHAAP